MQQTKTVVLTRTSTVVWMCGTREKKERGKKEEAGERGGERERGEGRGVGVGIGRVQNKSRS